MRPKPARRVRDYAYETLRPNTLVSYIDPENAASMRVAERLGARHDGTISSAGGRPKSTGIPTPFN